MAGGGDNAATPRKSPPNVRAGIDFPIGKTATLLKDHTSGGGPQFTDYAAVYFAASIEYLAAELAELSGIAAMNENAKVIEPRHVYSAVRNDEELTELLRKVDIEIDDNAEEEEEEEEEEEVNDDDEEYDYHSDDVDEDEIPNDIVEEEYDDDDTDTDTDSDIEEEVVTNASVGDHECEPVVVGQMSIAPDHVGLYMKLIDKFGEIVPPNLPNYRVAPTCVVLADLLNLVETMVDITPEEISRELVSDWEGMVSFYGGVGLKLGWLEERVRRYGDWLVRCSGVDVDQLRGKIAAKEDELEEKRKEVDALERELQVLSVELEMAHLSQAQFGFSFFDE